MASKSYTAYSNGNTVVTNYKGKVIINETNDYVNNQSTIQFYFYLYRCDGFTGSAHSFSSGNKIIASIYTFSETKTYPYPTPVVLTGTSESKPFLFYSGSIVVPHKPDGSMSFSFSFTYDQTQNNGQELDYVTVSGTHECTSIPRVSNPTLSSSSVTLGNSVTINTNRNADSFTHTITYSIGSASGTIGTSVGASTTFTPSKDLAKQFPNSTSGTITITCKTYSGSSLIGTSTVSLTVEISSDMIPTISSVTIAEATTLPSGISGYIKGKSKLKIAVSAAGSYGSTIKSYNIKANGETHTATPATTGVLTTSGSNSITVVVTDSRGKTSETKTSTITVLAYSAPYLSSVSTYRCASSSDSTASDTGAYMAITLKGAISSLNSKNAKTCTIYYKTTSATSWSSKAVTLSSYTISNTTILAASTDNAYDIKITVADSFGSATYDDYHVGTTFTLANFRSTGRGVAWGGVCQSDSFEVYMDEQHYGVSSFHDDVTVNGNIHGNIYMLNHIKNEIPSNADVNSVTYLIPGMWGIYQTSTAKTISNLPAPVAGTFITYSATGQNNTDANKTYYYARQEFIPYNLEYGRYERSVYSSATAGEFAYGAWKRVFYADETVAKATASATATTATTANALKSGIDIDVNDITANDIDAEHIDANSTISTKAALEIFATTPHIDFHFGSTANDYTARIIENSSGALTAYNSISSSSDERLKKEVDALPEEYLTLAERLIPHVYRFIKGDTYLNGGLIAQEVLALEQELGIKNSILVRGSGQEMIDPTNPQKTVIDYYSIDYSALTVVLLAYVVAQNKKYNEAISTLQQSVTDIYSKLATN